MGYCEQYEKWLKSSIIDEETRARLQDLNDEKEIENRFYRMLDFGTAGLRGIMGDGLYMMNKYTVRYATQGLADVIAAEGDRAKACGCCIAYDSRNHSQELAYEAVRVLAANGITCYFFDELRPTPELSFAVRHFGATAGINITASHNPKEYNGYKVYWSDGAQIAPELAAKISHRIASLDIFEDVKVLAEGQSSPLINVIGQEIDEAYLQKVLDQALNKNLVERAADDFSLVYTPLHGAGYRLVPECLNRLGFKNIITVPEQMVIDGDFPTVISPNPENKEGFTAAIELARRNKCDLIIGTDPDCDRLGVLIRDGSEFMCLSGNQIGVLLLNYIIQTRKEQGILPSNAAACKSIVSSPMADAVCAKYGVEMFSVLTGFKFIGEKIKEFTQNGSHEFVFGFEESNGYLSGSYARDKDAVLAAMLTAEMALWYKQQGLSLAQGLKNLFEEFGYYKETVLSFSMKGVDGLQKMQRLGHKLRCDLPSQLGGSELVSVCDLSTGETLDVATGKIDSTDMPRADVLFYYLADGSQIVFRPSGTEPKVKFYIMLKAATEQEAQVCETAFIDAVCALVDSFQ